jgi:hypothetical protein
MIIIVNSVPNMLAELVKITDKIRREYGVNNATVFTMDPTAALELVRQNKTRNDWTIVVTSGVFHDGFWSGVKLADHVKANDPEALVFLYSSFPESSPNFDGQIPKGDDPLMQDEEAALAGIVRFLGINLGKCLTRGKLERELAWLRK